MRMLALRLYCSRHAVLGYIREPREQEVVLGCDAARRCEVGPTVSVTRSSNPFGWYPPEWML